MSNFVVVDNIKFYEAKQGYYMARINKKPVRLHRYIWSKYNGEIPNGYDIHHKDHNKSNNSIENLELVDRHKHHSNHMKEPERVEQCKLIMKNIVAPKSADWHKSNEGRNWHKLQYEATLKNKWLNTIEKQCEVCHKSFSVSTLVAYRARFCSNKCKAYYRRHSGIDDIEVVCKICKKRFMTNKYSPALTCSQSCENVLRKQ